MNGLQDGSLRLLRVAGIDVFLHWSWFLVAAVEVQWRMRFYSSLAWNVAEYLTLFFIVLLHEFGHALACRSVGGRANRIVLWPLGGIAYVSPPPRPGPVLWSIAAGPLVNLLLVPGTLIAYELVRVGPFMGQQQSDLERYLFVIFVINLGLLLFNLLPVYPLDGGQIVQALMWFFVGRWRALQLVSFLGMFVGSIALLSVIVWQFQRSDGMQWRNWLLAAIAAFVALRALGGLIQANAVLRLLRQPRHEDAACPACSEAPVAGPFWGCAECGTQFDTFAARATCPTCGTTFPMTQCLLCREASPIEQWYGTGQQR
jgi:Zn-dependent protease